METIKVQMDKKKAGEVRALAMQMYGHKKGAITAALTSAIDEWILKARIKARKKRVPNWKKLVGVLKGEKMNSVEMQHYITKEIWPSMVD